MSGSAEASFRFACSFGDGIESDHLTLAWGQTARITVAAQRLHLLG